MAARLAIPRLADRTAVGLGNPPGSIGIGGLEKQEERVILGERDQGAPRPRKGNLPPEQKF
jgi:hypothetical protein